MIILFWAGHLLSYWLAWSLNKKHYDIQKHHKLFKTSKVITVTFLICIAINFLVLKPQSLSLIGTYTDWTLNLIFCFFADLFFIVFSAYYYKQAEVIQLFKKVDTPVIYRWIRKVYIISVIVRLLLLFPFTYVGAFIVSSTGLYSAFVTYPREDGLKAENMILFNDLYFKRTYENRTLHIYVKKAVIFKKMVYKRQYPLFDYYINNMSSDSISLETLSDNDRIGVKRTNNGYNIYGLKDGDTFTLKIIR